MAPEKCCQDPLLDKITWPESETPSYACARCGALFKEIPGWYKDLQIRRSYEKMDDIRQQIDEEVFKATKLPLQFADLSALAIAELARKENRLLRSKLFFRCDCCLQILPLDDAFLQLEEDRVIEGEKTEETLKLSITRLSKLLCPRCNKEG